MMRKVPVLLYIVRPRGTPENSGQDLKGEKVPWARGSTCQGLGPRAGLPGCSRPAGNGHLISHYSFSVRQVGQVSPPKPKLPLP